MLGELCVICLWKYVWLIFLARGKMGRDRAYYTYKTRL
jgi:hypothetical protein